MENRIATFWKRWLSDSTMSGGDWRQRHMDAELGSVAPPQYSVHRSNSNSVKKVWIDCVVLTFWIITFATSAGMAHSPSL